jgi:lipopolysaccharide export system protein LptA
VPRVEADRGKVQAVLPQGGGGDCGSPKPGGGAPLPSLNSSKQK